MKTSMEAPGGRPAIALQKLHKSFDGQVVLKGIDLEVRRGETVAVLGRSGTGKSVLLKLIVGLQRPDSGSVCIQGKEITSLPVEELNAVRTKMGFLFQEAALYDSLSVEDNVAFPLRRHHRASVREQRDRVRELLTLVGMEDDSAKLPAQLSGGMKKRVGLARALAMEPDILLFDEPTAGLDPNTAGEIEDLILKLTKDHARASVVVTHDLHGARTVSDRLALLYDGSILVEGTFEELSHSPQEFVSRFFREGS